MKTTQLEKQARKIECFPAFLARHINWQKVMDEFLSIWDRVVIDREENGSVLVKCYGKKDSEEKKESK